MPPRSTDAPYSVMFLTRPLDDGAFAQRFHQRRALRPSKLQPQHGATALTLLRLRSSGDRDSVVLPSREHPFTGRVSAANRAEGADADQRSGHP